MAEISAGVWCQVCYSGYSWCTTKQIIIGGWYLWRPTHLLMQQQKLIMSRSANIIEYWADTSVHWNFLNVLIFALIKIKPRYIFCLAPPILSFFPHWDAVFHFRKDSNLLTNIPLSSSAGIVWDGIRSTVGSTVGSLKTRGASGY